MNSSMRESFSSRTYSSERRVNTDPWQQQMHRSQSPHNYSTQNTTHNGGGNSSARNNPVRKSMFPSGEQGNRYKFDPDEVEQQSSVSMPSSNNLSSSQRTPPQQQSGPLNFWEEDNRPRPRSTQQQQRMFSSMRIPTSRPEQGCARRRSSDDYQPMIKTFEPFDEVPVAWNRSCVVKDEHANYQQLRKSDSSNSRLQSMRLSFNGGCGGEEMNASLTRLSYQPVASADSLQNQISANQVALNASTDGINTNRLNRMSFVSQQSTLSNLRTRHSSITMPRQKRSWIREVGIDLRGSTGCVLTEAELSELRELEAISHVDSKSQLEEGLALDEGDLNDCDVFSEPSHHLCEQKSVPNPMCSLTKSERFYIRFKRWLRSSQLEERSIEKNIQNSHPSGDTSVCKILSEDKLGVDCRHVINAFVCGGILIAVIIAVVVIFIAPSRSENSTSSHFEVDYSPTGPPARLKPPYSTLPLPVRDIEGRCSPSNFPGSVGACSEACDVAACCYPGFSAESCLDEADINSVEACERFRPHCDSMFAPWPDALKGGIAPPPNELFNKKEWDDVCLTHSGFEDVRLPNKRRSQHSYLTDHSNRRVGISSRFLNDTPIHLSTCKEACNPGRCCFAPLFSAGLFKTPDGVYINTTSGDMEMTSCVNERNMNRCLQYTKKCANIIQTWAARPTDVDNLDTTSTPTTDISEVVPVTTSTIAAWPSSSSVPSAAPQNSIALINVPGATLSLPKPTSLSTSLPSLSPEVQSSDEIMPSILLPQVYDINKFCTGSQTLLNIAEGVLNSVMDCQRACQPGLCCFVDLMVIGVANKEESCFSTNKNLCMAYSNCLALAMTPDDVAYLDSKGDYAVVDYITYGPPEPTADVAQFCSPSTTQAGVLECVKVCNPASCCGATDQDLSCFDQYEETCALYGPCLYMADAYGGDTKSMPPIPPADLSVLCAYSTLSKTDISSSECSLACLAGMCCLNNSCPPFDGIEELHDRCTLYEPCSNLLPIPLPSDDIEQVCEDNSLSGYSEETCTDACAVSSCCFTNDDDPCFSNFEDSCVAYAPYCAPSLQDNDVVTIQLQSAPLDLGELCVGPDASSECREACSVASCCFLLSDSENCWAENEEVCGQFAICAFLYQEYVESQGEFT
eukprot:CCRYP_004792-RB/>CCRYP_004792-RB protein AED:0.03 eAED:0.03 QI:513/1/1/1/0.5/0.33/3/133/1137